MLLGRIGQVKWANYPLSSAVAAFDSREELLEYLRFVRGPDKSTEWLISTIERLEQRPPSHRRFDLRRRVGAELQRRAGDLEVAKEPEAALFLYRHAIRLEIGNAAQLKRRVGLCLEALGKVREATSVCQSALLDATGEDALALERTGRRLSRAASLPWIPLAPLRRPLERELRIVRGSSGWGNNDMGIEEAVCSALPGRRAVHGEGRLWTGLFVLLFYDLLWDPIEGALPAPCLEGPLDLGRPGFAARRNAAFKRRIQKIRAGRCGRLLGRSLEAEGTRVRGMNWSLLDKEAWQLLLRECPPSGLAELMSHLGERGFGAASGMPDLFLWPGAPFRLDSALPSRVGKRGLLIEVKGPNDSLMDAQRVWHDRLLTWGFPVEVWRVRPLESRHADHRWQASRTKTPSAEGEQCATHFRPGPGGTLFDIGPRPDRV